MINFNVSHKAAHELFISGHRGTTVSEIAILATIAPVTVFTRSVLRNANVRNTLHASVQFLVDFTILMLPLILVFTVLADVAVVVLSTLAVVASALLVRHLSWSSDSFASLMGAEMSGRLPCLTNYRAFVNVASAICILAVDFQIFPRRFCKTETYGTGLMDVGVASYIFSNAIVSPEVRQRITSTRAFTRIINSIKSTGPLWVLGFCRLASVKATDYHEHVTEYGIYWNFFFTLAVVRVLSTALYCVINVKYSWLISLLIIVVYEMVLSLLGLREYILGESTGRLGFLAANREGIFSCIGYLALYCSGVQLGCCLLKSRSTVKEWLILFGVLAGVDALFWLLHVVSEPLFGEVSRRLTNLSYFIWMVAYNVQSLASFLLADLLQVWCDYRVKEVTNIPSSSIDKNDDVTTQTINNKHSDVITQTISGKGERVVASLPRDSTKHIDSVTDSNLLEAINFNGLLYFLLSNLLTGAVNMTIATMYATTSTALTVVIMYMMTVSAVVSVLHFYKLSLKFW